MHGLAEIQAKNKGAGPSVDEIIAYETGEMTHDRVVTFFQKLIDTGYAWRLQGHYGRTAAALIEAGHCTR